jgi:hypothetical protein
MFRLYDHLQADIYFLELTLLTMDLLTLLTMDLLLVEQVLAKIYFLISHFI